MSDKNLIPVEIEKSVLGSMMLEPDAADVAFDRVSENDFGDSRTRTVYQAISELRNNGKSFDMLSIENYLEAIGEYESIGAGFISDLSRSISSSANIEDHCEIIVQYASRRKLHNNLIQYANYLADPSREMFTDIDTVKDILEATDQRFVQNDGYQITELVPSVLDNVLKMSTGEIRTPGIPTGLDTDIKTGGLQNEYTLIGGRPSQGKTAFVLSVILYLLKQGYNRRILFYTYEMDSQAIVMRLLTMAAEIDYQKVRRGNINAEERRDLVHSATVLGINAEYGEDEGLMINDMASCPLYIYDSNDRDVDELFRHAKQQSRETNVGLLFIDYLQYMPTSRHKAFNSEDQENNYKSRKLKDLRKAIQCPVVAVVSFRRPQQTAGKPSAPSKSDIRQAGEAEYDADCIYGIHRPESYGAETLSSGRAAKGMAEVIIMKQRNGPTGTIPVRWIETFAKFQSLDMQGTSRLPNPPLSQQDSPEQDAPEPDEKNAPF